MLAEPQTSSREFQRMCIHQTCAALGQLPFAPFGKKRDEILARKHVEDGVAEKFELLIIMRQWSGYAFRYMRKAQFRNRRTVSQGALEQFRPGKLIAKPFLKLLPCTNHRQGDSGLPL